MTPEECERYLRCTTASRRIIRESAEWAVAEIDRLRKENAELTALNFDKGRKLAEAGVEGSPPPGQQTTMGLLMLRINNAEIERDRLWTELAMLRQERKST